MKLLGWMHRKLRKNSVDVYKNLAEGGTYNCLPGRPSLEAEDDHRLRLHRAFHPEGSFFPPPGGPFAGGGGDAAIEELLAGLLTIGTLGIAPDPFKEEAEEFATAEEEEAQVEAHKLFESEAPAAEAVAIPASMDAIAEKNAEETTEKDMLVLSVGLEKALAAEAEKCRPAASERISSARQSQGGSSACPLQGFLFGSSVELAETVPAEAAAGRSQRRASLGELFMKNRVAEEERGNDGERSTYCERTEEATGGGGAEGKPAVNGVHWMMKKMLKRRKSKGSDGTPAEGSRVEMKFQKILQMFRRKIHPETSGMSKKRSKQCKNEIKIHETLIEADDGIGCGSRRLIIFKGACRKESIPSYSCCSNPPSFTLSGSDSNGNREHWIKTDTDYLVLEL